MDLTVSKVIPLRPLVIRRFALATLALGPWINAPSGIAAQQPASSMPVGRPEGPLQGPPPSVAEPIRLMANLRQMLIDRRFKELTAVLEKAQRESRDGSESDDQWVWRIEAFRGDVSLGRLIDEWGAAEPRSWPPQLARCVHLKHQGVSVRGGGSWSSVDPGRRNAMAGFLGVAREACRRTVEMNPNVCAAYDEIEAANMLDGGETDAHAAERREKACSRYQSLWLTKMFRAMPQWGGSFEDMEMVAIAAKTRGVTPERVNLLRSYIAMEEASALRRASDTTGADARYERGLRESPSAALFLERAWWRARWGFSDPRETSVELAKAVEMSHGGWGLSPTRMINLLILRTGLMIPLEPDSARLDLELGLLLSPGHPVFLGAKERMDAMASGKPYASPDITVTVQRAAPSPTPTPSPTPSPYARRTAPRTD